MNIVLTKKYELEIHILTNHPVNPHNKCHFQTEGQNQVENLKTFLVHLGAVHLLRHTGCGWVGVSKSMTHYDRGGGMANYDV